MQVSFGAFYNFFTIYETAHGMSLETTSYLWAFGVICEIILFYFQAPLLSRFSLINLVKLGVFLTALRWFFALCFSILTRYLVPLTIELRSYFEHGRRWPSTFIKNLLLSFTMVFHLD